MTSRPTPEDDVRAIEALNQHDIEAVLAGDVAAITSQWTADFVVLHAAAPIVRGYAANAAMAEQSKAQLEVMEPLDYAVDIEEIKVMGDYAYEWGTFRGSARPRAGGETLTYSGKLMRILERQPDVAWKMHRTMVTTDPPPAQVTT